MRRGPEPAAGRGPEPEEARPSHREPAAEASSSHRGPAAADEEFVDVVEDEPEPVPMTPPPRARVLPLTKTGPRGPARAVEPVPLPVVDPQAEADLPEAGPRCSTAWLGADQWRGRGLWHHCPHFVAWGLRGRALYGGPTRQIELNEVRSRDPQLWDWANRAVRGTRMPLQYPAPIGFTATESSHLHLQLLDGTAAMPRARLVHQIAFATPTPPVTGMRRLHGSDLSAMNAFVGPLLAFGL